MIIKSRNKFYRTCVFERVKLRIFVTKDNETVFLWIINYKNKHGPDYGSEIRLLKIKNKEIPRYEVIMKLLNIYVSIRNINQYFTVENKF